jgi:hypothetical protein
MGFLNKLFGGSNTKGKRAPNQRAEFKDARFFEAMLKKKEHNIIADMETRDMLEKEGKLTAYHNWMMAFDYLDKFQVEYSMGHSIEQCYEVFIKAAEWYAGGWEEDSTYADMLEMVAIGYLLKIPDENYEGIVRTVEQSDAGSDYPEWKPDGILWFIINGRKARRPQPDAVIWPSLYQSLLDLTKMNKADAEAAMKQYLENWYELHRNDPWYDTHKKELAYTGYWCWEAGAISKIMGLDDTSYKDSPYYPYDLVHWKP